MSDPQRSHTSPSQQGGSPPSSLMPTSLSSSRHSIVRSLIGVSRTIVGFVADELGDWAALLDCGHRQHVRHRPPFRVAPWVEDATERERHIGMTLDCPLCDRCEVPAGLTVVRTTPTWDHRTMPPRSAAPTGWRPERGADYASSPERFDSLLAPSRSPM